MQEQINELKETLLSQETYKDTKNIKDSLMQQDKSAMQIIITTIAQVLEDRQSAPMQKLMAVRLSKETMELQIGEFVRQYSLQALPKIQRVALFKKEDKSESRGKFFFSNEPSKITISLITSAKQQASIGNSLLRLALDSLYVWAIWYPIDPQTNSLSPYKRVYDDLLNQGVAFPKLSYYKPEDLTKKNLIQSETAPQTEIKQLETKPKAVPSSSIQFQPSAQIKKKINELMINIKLEQEFIADLIANIQTQEDLEMLDESEQNFSNYKEQSEQCLNDAITQNLQDKDFEELLLIQDFVDMFLNDFQLCKNKKMGLSQFKQKILNFCSPTPNPDFTTPQPEKIAKTNAKQQQLKLEQIDEKQEEEDLKESMKTKKLDHQIEKQQELNKSNSMKQAPAPVVSSQQFSPSTSKITASQKQTSPNQLNQLKESPQKNPEFASQLQHQSSSQSEKQYLQKEPTLISKVAANQKQKQRQIEFEFDDLDLENEGIVNQSKHLNAQISQIPNNSSFQQQLKNSQIAIMNASKHQQQEKENSQIVNKHQQQEKEINIKQSGYQEHPQEAHQSNKQQLTSQQSQFRMEVQSIPEQPIHINPQQENKLREVHQENQKLQEQLLQKSQELAEIYAIVEGQHGDKMNVLQKDNDLLREQLKNVKEEHLLNIEELSIKLNETIQEKNILREQFSEQMSQFEGLLNSKKLNNEDYTQKLLQESEEINQNNIKLSNEKVTYLKQIQELDLQMKQFNLQKQSLKQQLDAQERLILSQEDQQKIQINRFKQEISQLKLQNQDLQNQIEKQFYEQEQQQIEYDMLQNKINQLKQELLFREQELQRVKHDHSKYRESQEKIVSQTPIMATYQPQKQQFLAPEIIEKEDSQPESFQPQLITLQQTKTETQYYVLKSNLNDQLYSSRVVTENNGESQIRLQKPKQEDLPRRSFRSESLGLSILKANNEFPKHIYSKVVKKRGPSQNQKTSLLAHKYNDIIFPYSTAHDYYKSRIIKAAKGRLIGENRNRLQMPNALSQNLKVCLIKEKHYLINTKQFVLGCSIGPYYINNERHVKIELYFISQMQQSVDVKVKFQFSESVNVQIQGSHERFTLNEDQSIKTELLFSLKDEVGFTMSNCQVEIMYEISLFTRRESVQEGQPLFGRIATVVAVVRGFREDPLERVQEDMEEQHYQLLQNVKANDERHAFRCRRPKQVLQRPHRIKRTQERGLPGRGIDEIKYGGLWKIKNSKFLLRFVVSPVREIIIQIVQFQGKKDIRLIESLIDTLSFIFSE